MYRADKMRYNERITDGCRMGYMKKKQTFYAVGPYYYWLTWGFLIAMVAACLYFGWIIQWRHTNTAWQNFWGVSRIMVPCTLLTFLLCNANSLSSVVVWETGIVHRACLGYALARYSWQEVAEVGVVGDGQAGSVYLYLANHPLTPQERKRVRRDACWICKRKDAPIILPYTQEALDAIRFYWKGTIVRYREGEKPTRMRERPKRPQ